MNESGGVKINLQERIKTKKNGNLEEVIRIDKKIIHHFSVL